MVLNYSNSFVNHPHPKKLTLENSLSARYLSTRIYSKSTQFIHSLSLKIYPIHSLIITQNLPNSFTHYHSKSTQFIHSLSLKIIPINSLIITQNLPNSFTHYHPKSAQFIHSKSIQFIHSLSPKICPIHSLIITHYHSKSIQFILHSLSLRIYPNHSLKTVDYPSIIHPLKTVHFFSKPLISTLKVHSTYQCHWQAWCLLPLDCLGSLIVVLNFCLPLSPQSQVKDAF